MKIRHPAVIKWIGFVGSIIIRIWIGTLSFRQRYQGTNVYPNQNGGAPGRYIYVFWHENILVPCYHFAQRDIKVLISEHSDGEMIALICKHLGYGTIRGSKTRGGMKAMREMIRASSNCHLAVMPDGPRGPRRRLELGLIYLAAKTGLPIIVAGVGHDRPWRLNTWDRFVLPRPWSKSAMILSDPIPIREDADRAQLEEYRAQVEQSLNDITESADRLASL